MATGAYIGVAGAARKVTAAYIGVAGTAHWVRQSYIGVDGVARESFDTANRFVCTLTVVAYNYRGESEARSAPVTFKQNTFGYVSVNGTIWVGGDTRGFTVSAKFTGVPEEIWAETTEFTVRSVGASLCTKGSDVGSFSANNPGVFNNRGGSNKFTAEIRL